MEMIRTLLLVMLAICMVQCNVLKDIDKLETQLQSFLDELDELDEKGTEDELGVFVEHQHGNTADTKDEEHGINTDGKIPPNEVNSAVEEKCPSVEKIMKSLTFQMVPDEATDDVPEDQLTSYSDQCQKKLVCFKVCYGDQCMPICRHREQCHLSYNK